LDFFLLLALSFASYSYRRGFSVFLPSVFLMSASIEGSEWNPHLDVY